MSETVWTLILVGIYLIYAFLPMVLNYQYIYFSDDGIILFSDILLQELLEEERILLK